MKIYNDFNLATILWYKIGGTAKYLLECKNPSDVLEALEFIQKEKIEKLFVLGTGSNLVFTDDYFDGAVIYLAQPEAPSFTRDGEIVTAYAGESLSDLILFAFEQDLVGLEWAGGLPGTVGAAVRGNVGAYGGEIKDCVFSAEVAVISDGGVEVKTLHREELQFEYRGSVIKANRNNMVVLSAAFKLKEVSQKELAQARARHDANIAHRKARHPLEYPNCGSVFKNIRDQENIEKVLRVYPDLADRIKNDWYGKVAMAYLIQKLGLQGMRVGNAQISEKHALFIINLGGAKASDVRSLINTVQQNVQETFGFIPEVEVEIIE